MVLTGCKLAYLFAVVALVNANNIVKGVDPKDFGLYQPAKDGMWTCLDGSKLISHSAINDDYCDCSDGSDEPGTSACSNSRYYCANIGHIPAYIKSSAVNDGVCDETCCDGSDEDGTLITCPNRCIEIGQKYREYQSSLKTSTEAGLSAKRRLIDEAEMQVRAWEEQQSKVEDQIILKKSNVLRLQRELTDLESRSSTNKRTRSNCSPSAPQLETLKFTISSLQMELETLKTILGDMKRDHNHNFHDMAVKSAISGYDEFLARYDDIKAKVDSDLEDTNREISLSHEEMPFDETEVDSEEMQGKHDGQNSVVQVVLDSLDAILPTILKENVLDKWLPARKNNDSVQSKLLIDNDAIDTARSLFHEAEHEVHGLENELEKIKQDLSADYGVKREWLKLKDVCVEKNEGEYTYSLCFLGDAYQKSNKDSTKTFLGKFNKYDDDSNTVHIHNQGTKCWNGPERSVKAKIECGVKNEILEVTEPEKCEYHFKMTSPAVCQTLFVGDDSDTIQSKHTDHMHEEL